MSEYSDRREAGRALGAEVAARLGTRSDALVLAIGRGGVPIGWEVAQAIGAPLDILLVAPITSRRHGDAILGAVACGGVHIVDHDRAARLGVAAAAIAEEVARLDELLHRRELAYRGLRPRREAAGRTCIVADDGLSPATTIHAALAAVSALGAAEVLFAAPSTARDAMYTARAEADGVITCAAADGGGTWYEDFERVGEGEIRAYLDGASARPSAAPV